MKVHLAELDMDEMALRMAESVLGLKRPPGKSPSEAIDHLIRLDPGCGAFFRQMRSAATTAAGYFVERLAEKAGPDAKLGASGEFPDGKIGVNDEGQLTFALAANRKTGCVHIDFGTPVAWMALPPSLARTMSAGLLEQANILDPKGTN